MGEQVSKRQRLETTFALKNPDRTPILGGWLACPQYIMELTGATADEYWADSIAVSIEAYEHLGMDGLITIFVPRNQSDYRCVDNISYSKADIGMSLEQAVAEIDAMPTPEKTEIFKNVRKP